jgi:hypothetical protein
MISRTLGCTLMMLGAVFLPACVAGCDTKPATSPSNKDGSSQPGKDNPADKPKPPDRDPG